MVKIDLNADLGEGSRADAELMTLVSSVNIACGFHAGDAQTMLESVRNAIKNGVAIGAHPSFPDRENFGRTAMDAIARAVRDCDSQLILVGLAGSELIRAGQRLGLTTRQEVFADRGYQPDGSLVPRTQAGALITDEGKALAQTLEMVRAGRVIAVDGTSANVQADTVCLHGDGEHALQFARRLRAAFSDEGILVSAE